jgi:hypothetical protein
MWKAVNWYRASIVNGDYILGKPIYEDCEMQWIGGQSQNGKCGGSDCRQPKRILTTLPV